MQYGHAPRSAVCKSQRHRSRRYRGGQHRQKGGGAFLVDVGRGCRRPTGQAGAGEKCQLIRAKGCRQPESRESRRCRRTGRNQWLRRNRELNGLCSLPVCVGTGMKQPHSFRKVIGIVADRTVKQQVNLMAAIEQPGCEQNRNTLGSSSAKRWDQDCEPASWGRSGRRVQGHVLSSPGSARLHRESSWRRGLILRSRREVGTSLLRVRTIPVGPGHAAWTRDCDCRRAR